MTGPSSGTDGSLAGPSSGTDGSLAGPSSGTDGSLAGPSSGTDGSLAGPSSGTDGSLAGPSSGTDGSLAGPSSGTDGSLAGPSSGTDAPLGIFDSGVGGLTVARSVIDLLPAERVVYVGDTAHGPYGPLRIADIRRHALAVGDALMERGVKALVVACNTASAACLADIRERYPVPVVEVIRPAVRRAVAATHSGRVGVIGTRATIASGAYTDAFDAARDVEVTAVACPRFVDFVERGMTSGRQVLGLAQGYLEPLQRAGVDTVVLGCTHYPLLTGVLQIVLGPDVTLVSSAEETAKDLVRVLMARDLLREIDPAGAAPAHEFLATGDPEPFRRLGRRFLGPEIGAVAGLATAARAVP